MKLFNQLTRNVEVFRPKDPRNLKLYTCGPTVYSFAHIGNFASYVYWDLLVRTLTANGWTVNRILNLTDVGHLTSDADDGEDKLEKGARREGKTVWEVAEMYSEAFLKDFRRLNLVEPTKICRATDYIEQDKALVDLLTEHGYTYETSDGLYFDTSKFKDYANFAQLDLDQLKAGARVALSSEKRHASDFAVWKFIKPGEDHAMRWDYLGRPGYPGWHLECSTICHEELGEPLDIHTGGIDHLPVHHTNEIAETYGAFGVPLARFWTHCNFTTIDGQKISKSLGNTYTLDQLAERGFDPLDFKMWVLQGHYQTARDFSFASLTTAQARRRAWQNRYAEVAQEEGIELDTQLTAATPASPANSTAPATPANSVNSVDPTPSLASNPANFNQFCREIFDAVSDNLNSPLAFSIIDRSELTVADWRYVDNLFGLELTKITPPSQEVLDKIAERERYRAERNFEKADALRAEIAALGYAVLDRPSGPIWQLA